MIVLVTGATGFLGSSLTEKLLSEGVEVVGLGRKKKGFLNDEIFKNPLFKFIQMDLENLDVKKLSTLNFDTIVHLASQQPTSSTVKFDDYIKNNICVTRNLISISKKFEIDQFVFSSTTAMFGESSPENRINEGTPPVPRNYYSLSKYVAERLIYIDLLETKIKSVIIRFPSLVGLNHFGGIVHAFYEMANNNTKINIFNNGNLYRNLLYVGDAVNIIYHCLKLKNKLNNFELFLAGSCDSRKTIDIARIIKDGVSSKSELIPVNNSAPNSWDVFIDTSKIKNILGVKAMSVEQGLRQYLKEMKHGI